MEIKTHLSYLLLFTILSASECKQEDVECNYNITIKNNSTVSIISAILISGYGEPIPSPNAQIKCRLDGQEIQPGDTHEYRPYNTCIENRLSGGDTQDIFIVDPDYYNDEKVLYDCDSIEIKNKILKHYSLTLKELQDNNFTITYQ